MKFSFLITAMIAVLAFGSHAHAIEPLSAKQLASACGEYNDAPKDPGAQLCVYYIKGFLDGAAATDERVAENVVSEINRQSAFTERAIRNRVMNRIWRFGPTAYAEFCIGQPDPIEDVVRHVIEQLEDIDLQKERYAQDVVYETLQRHYPCAADREG